MPLLGIEPKTYSLQGSCATTTPKRLEREEREGDKSLNYMSRLSLGLNNLLGRNRNGEPYS